jgi:electron transport complex protein RnfC
MRRLMVSILEQALKIPGGLRLASNKAQSLGQALRQARIPERLVVPVSQHIGTPGEAMVSVGDKVLKGQTIARSLAYTHRPPGPFPISANIPYPTLRASRRPAL